MLFVVSLFYSLLERLRTLIQRCEYIKLSVDTLALHISVTKEPRISEIIVNDLCIAIFRPKQVIY